MEKPTRSAPPGRTVALAGATGLVGREILKGLLADDSVAAVHALGRRPPGVEHPKLVSHVADFANLPPLPRLDEVYLALGTTIRAAVGRHAAFLVMPANSSVNPNALNHPGYFNLKHPIP